jgi:hypothetical protein
MISRVVLPGDNSQVLLEETPTGAVGLVVDVLNEEALHDGDLVEGINGRPLGDWLAASLEPGSSRPELEYGESLNYTLLRDGSELTLPVRLEVYQLGQALLQRWSLYFFLFYLLAVSIVVFARRPHIQAAQMFLLVSSAIFASGLIFFLGLQISDLLRPAQIALWFWGSIILYGLLTAGLFHFAFVFPYSSFPSRRRITILAIYSGVWIPYLLMVFFFRVEAHDPVEILLLLARSTAIMTPIYFPLVLIFSTLKYRRAKNPVARRQMRWILWAFIIANVPWLVLSTVPAIFGETSQIASNVTGLLWCLIPTAFAISILREGLFDIDVIIHRTLVYGLLTGLLILIYFGTVILMQTLFTAVSGQQSAVAIVISTLVIAALFQPLRHRIQGWIDRRFFRRKYDASRTLASFASKARDEVDLEQLSDELLDVVAKTMQPEQVWLWIKPAGVEQTLPGKSRAS